MSEPWTPLSRTVAALSFREADRPPVFLLTVLQGARELGLSLKDYFSRSAHVVEGQLRLRQKFGGDCLYAFHHAALEHEAWGAETLYREDGPPNAGAPAVRRIDDLERLEAPRLEDSEPLQRIVETVAGLAAAAKGEVPVAAVVMSPFSLPVMQLGFSTYLDLLLAARERPESREARLLQRLLAVNEEAAVRLANAELAAGATAVVYFDPVSSSTISAPELGVDVGLAMASRVLRRIKGPTVLHFASGRIAPRLDAALATGAAALGVSAEDDLADLKRRSAGKLSLVGNLNGVEMIHWTPEQAHAHATRALDQGAPGGGFVLSDNHGEIPLQVPDAVLHAIIDAARRWRKEPAQGTA